MLTGGCHCGAIRFEMPARPVARAICHCGDCRRHAGAPMVAWAMVPVANVAVRGEPKVYASSETGRRSFCGDCGTGLFFTNAALRQMGMTQVRIGALDEPEAVPPDLQVQVAERIPWMAEVHALPAVERFPG